jgi:hypothetical protein
VRHARLAHCRRPLDHAAIKVDVAAFRCCELRLARAVEQCEPERVDRIRRQVRRDLVRSARADVDAARRVLFQARDVERLRHGG